MNAATNAVKWPYTVVLRRPFDLCEWNQIETENGGDLYIAHKILATSIKDAVKQAQQELYDADKRYLEMGQHVASGYEFCFIFKGHHAPITYGWVTRWEYVNG